MPRPPVLPVIDWERVFEGGKSWENWLKAAESASQADDMRQRFTEYKAPEAVAGKLKELSRDVHVIAIAEDWCGDVIKHAPVVARLEQMNPRVKVRFISREDRPDVFVRFLTNGGEAIPKFVFLNSDFVECGNWGPMPAKCREFVARGKAIGNVGAGREKVRAFYAMDPEFKAAFEELGALVELAGSTEI